MVRAKGTSHELESTSIGSRDRVMDTEAALGEDEFCGFTCGETFSRDQSHGPLVAGAVTEEPRLPSWR
jgi:hypothetical protein